MRPVRPEANAAQIARELEQKCPGWVVIWSAWRQAFTAFSAVTAEALVIDDSSAYRLLQRIGEAQRTRPRLVVPADSGRGAGPSVAGGEGPVAGGLVRPRRER
ncbi:hypothetical protein GCM10023195_80420 [Actinoallomurus liliacearum]|uniref:Uncharacterized protein n=1 Tax=Actinoallomurus liliacearum TaxID=1080073 RepID=A0ABP8TZ34_9ACTN